MFCDPTMASWAFSVSLFRFMALAHTQGGARCAVCLAVVAAQCPERFEMFTFLVAEGRRKLDVHARVEVPGLLAIAHRRHAVAFEAEQLPVLRERRDTQSGRLAGQ